MTKSFRFRRSLLPSLLASFILASCAGESPEQMLASAKDYLAKNDSKAAVIQIKNALQKNPDLGEARYLLGKALLEGGDAVSAEVELRKARTLNYLPDQTTPMLANALLQQGQPKKLLAEFGSVRLGSAEANADLLTTVSISHASTGNVREAEKSLQAALAAKGDYAPALMAQSRIKAMQGDLAAATTIIDSVVAQSPANAQAWKLKGDLMQSQREFDQAVAAYRKAVEAKPDFLLAHAALVSLYVRTKMPEDAGKQIAELKKVAPKHPTTIFLDAQHAFQKRDVPKARELIQQVLKVAPDYPPGLMLAGLIEYHGKSYPQAEVHLGKLVRLAPESLEARRLLSMVHLGMGQPARAMSVLEPVIGKIDQNSNMLSLAGQIAMQNGDVAKAEQYFIKAARLDPKNVPKRTALALTHLAKGDDSAFAELEEIASSDSGVQADMVLIATHLRRNEFDKALRAIDGLQKKQPSDPIAPHLRGAALLGKKDVGGARKSFEVALKLRPDYYPSAAALASLDLADKKTEDARKRFEAVLAADPKSIQALLALASLKQQNGGTPGEVSSLIEKAIAANPLDPNPRLALIEVHARSKDFKKAMAVAQDAVAAIPDQPSLLSVLGQVQMAAGEPNQALVTFGKLAGLQPLSPSPHLRIAEVHLSSKNREGAVQSLRKALEIKPDLVEAQRGLIGLHLESGAVDKALELTREVQKQRPKEAIGFGLEGDVRASKRSWAEAAAAYRAGINVAPGSELAIKLHSVLVAAGKVGEADKFMLNWSKAHPTDFGFRLHMGDQLLAAKDLAGAAQEYRTVVDAQPNNVLALNNLAWVSAQQKSPKALEYAERANRISPNNPAVMDTLAMILLDKGENKRATDLLLAALNSAPDAHVIRLNLARALIKSGDTSGARKELEQLAKLGDKFSEQTEVSRLIKGL